MKIFWFFYAIFCVLIAVSVVYFIQKFEPLKSNSNFKYSPLPSFLTLSANAQVTTLDIWSPNLNELKNDKIIQPDITAQSAISYDLTSNQLLFQRDTSEKLPMASLTKIMTAVVALENKKTDDKYLVTNAAIVGEDSMRLDAGESLSLKELLYGLILHSGNDAAMTLALNYPGGVNRFVRAMNQKALALGLTSTHFTNPSGLEGDGNQYTTAYDLLVITKYAMQNFSDFRDVVSTFDYIIPQTPTHKEFDLENETNLLTSYPGVKGVKTGYTPEAGLCLVTYLEYQDHKIIAVVLGSENRRDDMKEILDYSLKKLGTSPPMHG